MSIRIEWDEQKRVLNRTKHGLDFDDARHVLSQPMLVVEDERKNYGEQRFRGLGQLQDIVVLIAFALRTDVLRIISMRPASFQPETLLFPDAETGSFQFGNEQFFILARKSSNYEEAYLNTLTKNCED